MRCEVNLCPEDECEQWAEVWADGSEFDPGDTWSMDPWRAIGIDEIAGEKVGEDWLFVCTCGEECSLWMVQAKVSEYLRG